MQKANEIRNALENIKYYSKRVKELAKEQFELDMKLPKQNAEVGSLRFRNLEGIMASCGGLEMYCTGIENAIGNIVKLGKELQSEEQEEIGELLY